MTPLDDAELIPLFRPGYMPMKHRRLPIRPFGALALESRILLDAAVTATAAKIVDATDTQPGVAATAATAAVHVDDASGKQSVDLFSDVTVTPAGDNGELHNLVVTVDSAGANQALTIDGSTVALTSSSGTTANNGYTYTVATRDTTTTVTLNIASSQTGYDGISAAALIDSIAYTTLDNSVAGGTVTLTLTRLTDYAADGMSDGDSAELGIRATVSIDSQVNAAPILSDIPLLERAESIAVSDLGNEAQVVYSRDARHAYVAGNSSVSVFSVDALGRLTLQSTLAVDGMGSATEMVASVDGHSIYTIDGSSTIYAFTIADDGTLSLTSTVATGNGDAAGGLAISDDGEYVYVGTAYNDVAIFSRDANNGELSYLARAPGESGANTRNGYITTSGNYVYVAYAHFGSRQLFVYERNNDGTLSTVTRTAFNSNGYDDVDYSLAVSRDGSTLYLADPENGNILVYHFSDGNLSLLETVDLNGVENVIISHDGSTVYASGSDAVLHIYAVSSDGKLSQSHNINNIDADDLAVSSDGYSLLAVSATAVTRYSTATTLNQQGEDSAFAGNLTLADSNFDALANGAGNYLGASIHVSASSEGGHFGFIDSNGLSYADGIVSLDGAAVATLSSSGSTLTVTFTAATTTALANQVLHQLSYANDSAEAGSYITLSVSVSDGALFSQNSEVLLRVNSTPQIDTGAAEGYSLGTSSSETAYSFTLFSGLFSDVDGDALTWSVSGLPPGLSFDASTRTISGSATATGTFAVTVSVTDASGASASLALELVVTQIDNRAPQANAEASTRLASATAGSAYSTTLSASLFSDADSIYGDSLSWSISGLPNGINFDAASRTLSGTATAVGDYTVTVIATDTSGASSSLTLSLRVISTHEASNTAPVLEADTSALNYSSDGALSGFDQYVTSLTLSNDGSILVVAANTSTNANGTTHVYVYSRDTGSGALTLLQTFVQGTQNDGDDRNGIEVDGLNSVTSIAYSNDGSLLYATGYTSSGSTSAYSITCFKLADDGSLSALGSITNLSEKVLQVSTAQDSDTLYALSTNHLYAYHIGKDGVLTLIDSDINDFGTAVTLSIDEEGTVYVLASSRLTLYSAADDGSLSYAGQLSRGDGRLIWTDRNGNATTAGAIDNPNAFTGGNALAVTDNGNVYLTTSNGYLTTLHYDSTVNRVTLVDVHDAYSDLTHYPGAIALSKDGSTLYVASHMTNMLALYTLDETGAPKLSATVATAGAMSRLVVSSDGHSIYGGKNLYFGTVTLSIVSADGVGLDYAEHSTTALAGAITLADADYDALADGKGNYNGATISVVRNGGANIADTYGFIDGNGLTLSTGVIYFNGAAIARFNSGNGSLKLTFTADISTATTNQVLRQISYTNTSKDPGSRIALTLSVSDAYTTHSIDLALSVIQVNQAPSLDARGATTRYVIGGQAVRLFSDSVVSTAENGQLISGLTVMVAGLADGENEILSFNGTRITLTDGTSADGSISITATDGRVSRYEFTASVSVSDGIATITLSSDSGLSTDAAAALIDGLAYANNSETPSASARTITLTAVQDNGGTAAGGTDTTQLAITASVDIDTHNDAPAVTATGASVSYLENGQPVALFGDVSVSTVEGGQAIAGLRLSVDGIVDGNSETLTIDGTVITLVEGNGTTSSGYAYGVTVSAGTATVSLHFEDGISTATTSSLVSAMTYADRSEDPHAGTRIITLTAIQDDGGTANGGKDTATLAISARVSVVPINDAPILDATAANTLYSISGGSVTLFSEVTVSPADSGQAVAAITFTVSGLADGDNEILTIDGTAIALVQGSGTTASGYAYTVTLDAGTATVIVSASDSAGIASDASAALIGQVSYTNLDAIKTAGIRSISVGVQDNGGTNHSGVDSTMLEASATVEVVNNHAPVFSADADLNDLKVVASLTTISGLSNIATAALSAQGDYLYVADNHGTVVILARDSSSGALTLMQPLDSGLASVTSIDISGDGSVVYVLGDSGNHIAVYSRGSNGELTLAQTLNTEHVTDLAVSTDGGALYLIDGNYSGLRVYTRDSSTGQYALAQTLPATTDTEPYLFNAVSIELASDFVYVVTDPTSDAVANTLIVYRRADDGTLSSVGYARDGDATGDTRINLSVPVDIAVANDGATIYVAGADGITVFGFDSSRGVLSYQGTLGGLSEVTAIALSSDNATVYLTRADGHVDRYTAEGSRLTLLETIDSDTAPTLAGAGAVLSAANGAVIVVGSGGLVSLKDGLAAQVPVAYTEQDSMALAAALTLSDSEYDALNNGAGNYAGAILTVVRAGGADPSDGYGFIDGNGLRYADGVVSLEGQAIATLISANGTLTLSFTAEVSTATANHVLHQLSYRSSSDDLGNGTSLILTVSDQYAASTHVELTLQVTAINDAPVLTSTGATVHQTQGDAAVPLFSDTAVDTQEAGQTISRLTLTVAGVSDGASETLTIDGTAIALVAGSGTTRSGYGYDVSVDIASDRVTLTVSSGKGIASADLAALINGIRYADGSDTPSEGIRTVTLTSVSDDGGHANNGVDTRALAISARVTVAAATVSDADGSGNGAELSNVGSVHLMPQADRFAYFDQFAPHAEHTSAGEHSPQPVSPPATLPRPAFGHAGSANGPTWDGPAPADATQLLDALLPPPHQAQLDQPLTVVFSDGSHSPLVTLAAADSPTLTARQSAIHDRWHYDAAANRMVVQLPSALFSARATIASLSLRDAHGRAVVGVRLDVANGRLIAAGARADSMELHLIVRTVDGQTLTVPIQVGAAGFDGGLRDSVHTPSSAEKQPLETGKPALDAQLRQQATHDLLAEARALLEQLLIDDDAPVAAVAERPVSSAG